MATTLLAVVLVLIAAHTLPDLARLRDFAWLKAWLAAWNGGDRARPLPAIVVPLIVVAVCALIQIALAGWLFGLPAFAFALVVLFYCWGPRDLDEDIGAVLAETDRDQRAQVAQRLRPDPAERPLPADAACLVEATFQSALSRWFGVLFWFAILGPAGAIGYRVVQLMARVPAFRDELSAADRNLFERIALALDWAPAHLMALTLALVSDFDSVVRTWREYHAAHGRGYFTLDLGFLGVLARAGVDADVIAGDGYATDVTDPVVELTDARTVLRRILVTWLAILALLVLAGWVH
jgi:AmpE protein